jgi:hypothetical protein
MTKTGTEKKKIIRRIICAVLVIMLAGDWFMSVRIYNKYFNQRYESYEPLMLYVDDFEGLQRTQYLFSSDQGQTLTGYLYWAGEDQRGIVVMAHGLGGRWAQFLHGLCKLFRPERLLRFCI